MIGSAQLVSVIMPAYNVEKYIAQAIESVLAQTYEHWELIVVDDASKDQTAEVVRSFEDPRIKLMRLEANGGVSHARNVAMEHSSGEWLATLDPDDAWHEKRLEVLMQLATQYPYGRYIFLDDIVICYDKDGKLIPNASALDKWSPELKRRIGKAKVVELDMHTYLLENKLIAQPLFPSRIVKEKSIIYPEELPGLEDLYFLLKLFNSGLRCLLLAEPYRYYRIRQGSLTAAGPEKVARDFEAFWKAIFSDPDFTEQERNWLKQRHDIDRQQLWYHLLTAAYRRRRFGYIVKYLLAHPEVVVKLPKPAFRFVRYRIKHLYSLISGRVVE